MLTPPTLLAPLCITTSTLSTIWKTDWCVNVYFPRETHFKLCWPNRIFPVCVCLNICAWPYFSISQQHQTVPCLHFKKSALPMENAERERETEREHTGGNTASILPKMTGACTCHSCSSCPNKGTWDPVGRANSHVSLVWKCPVRIAIAYWLTPHPVPFTVAMVAQVLPALALLLGCCHSNSLDCFARCLRSFTNAWASLSPFRFSNSFRISLPRTEQIVGTFGKAQSWFYSAEFSLNAWCLICLSAT